MTSKAHTSSWNPFHYLTLTLFLLPPLALIGYFFISFPHPRTEFPVHPGLASLPLASRSWEIYPPDFYEGGAYADLPQGQVRYWLLGPEDGKKVVLIHGLSVPAIIWKDVAPQLVAKGFRVLLYDLYGRGYSEAPQTIYDVSLYTTQLALLMQHIKWDQSASCWYIDVQFPRLVNQNLVLISPAGALESSDMSRTVKIMASSLVQYLASNPLLRSYLQHLTNSSSVDAQPNPIAEIVRLQSAYLPGFNAAVASSIRDGPIRGIIPSYRALGASAANHRVLIIHGTADNTVPYKCAPLIMKLLSPTTQSPASANPVNTSAAPSEHSSEPDSPTENSPLNNTDHAAQEPLSLSDLSSQPTSSRSELITIQNGGHDLTDSHTDDVVAAIVRWFGPEEEVGRRKSWFGI